MYRATSSCEPTRLQSDAIQKTTKLLFIAEGVHVLSPEEQYKWLKAKEEVCSSGISSSSSTPTGYGLLCPQVWDGIMCWPPTPAGKNHEQPCAEYFAGFDHQANASKLCLPSGQWFRDASNTTWTNYSRCFSDPTITVPVNFSEVDNNPLISEYFPALKTIAQVGYTVSLSTLVIACCILATIKKLRCPRNMLHLHLFVSFIMRAFMALLKDILFVGGVGLRMDVVEKNGSSYFYDQSSWLCKTVTSIWQYCIMANYSWILMEGLYLHNLIFLALFSDTSAITLYVGCRLSSCFLGLLYVPFLRTHCVGLQTLVSCFFCSSAGQQPSPFLRWAKSTLVLVPLFGVHYTVFLGMSYSIGVHPGVEIAWLFCDQLFASFQGFFVAVLYCFLNGEVQGELKRQWLHSGSLRRFFCSPLRPGHCYSSTDCSSLSMGPANFSGRKLRQGGKRLSTSFVGPSTESHYAIAPNASEATAALGLNSKWCPLECSMPGCYIEMGHVNPH
ncbi:parathyroid hormone 2 receptor isoform X5 [Cryptotermes secundus]|uniref:parathyroid hormone 2 receptor isoform X5 n=1 Tax=Cryptotermes secundus TaxID=105785 RepID=UPI001454D0E5|nr:parathyroid hormone 2 receptor isoform X5 [Cryptotermes secundus]